MCINRWGLIKINVFKLILIGRVLLLASASHDSFHMLIGKFKFLCVLLLLIGNSCFYIISHWFVVYSTKYLVIIGTAVAGFLSAVLFRSAVKIVEIRFHKAIKERRQGNRIFENFRSLYVAATFGQFSKKLVQNHCFFSNFLIGTFTKKVRIKFFELSNIAQNKPLNRRGESSWLPVLYIRFFSRRVNL